MKVFISYSHIDKGIVEQIISFFKDNNIRYFLDEKDINWGDNIKKKINDEISKDITHELVIISPASVKSQWVAYEIGFASAKGVTILPYLTHPSIDIPSFISEYNYVAKMDDLKDFFEKAMEKVVYMRIVNEEGVEEKVQVVIAFEFKDTKKEYVIYTKDERDNNGNVTAYISSVDRSGEMPQLQGVSPSEWDRVKAVVRKLADKDGQNDFYSNLLEDVRFTDGEETEYL